MRRERSDEYQLARRPSGGALLGLRVPQVLLLAIAIGAFVFLSAITHSVVGVCTGATVAACGVTAAFGRINGEPIHSWAPVVMRFAFQRAAGGSRWTAPLPLLSGTAQLSGAVLADRRGRREATLPRCLTGLELRAVTRPGWAGSDRTLASVGVIGDRRRGTLTVLIGACGSGFSLLEQADQHALLGDWGQVLAQFGREVSPVVRLGWTLWSAPSPAGASHGHLEWLVAQKGDDPRLDEVGAKYRKLLDDTPVQRHELLVWITVAAGQPVDTRDKRGRARPDPADAALAAARALTDRCSSAGLVMSDPLSPVQIARTIRSQSDPTAIMHAPSRGLAERAGVASGVSHADIAPLAMDARWDAVRVDGSWHRAFWISQWPQHVSDPRWLEPLLMSPPSIRTLAVSYEPISPRASHRKITSEAVAIDSQLQLRERHDLRVPVGLQNAHQEIDQRESELSAGHTEVGLLALLVVTETSLERLDLACHATLDLAAQCGIADLRPLHARHDAAWACTLPLGRVPDRELLQGLPG
jgi:hypothetical protein